MQQPRDEEDDNSRDDDRGDIAIPPQLEEQRIVEDLHHEVLPVDVYPPPEVGEAGREAVEVVSGCQVESEEMQHSRDEVEIAGDAQIEPEISHEVLLQRSRVDNLRRADSPVVVDDPIEEIGRAHV